MVYLQELPLDVLIHILSFVKPLDIILGIRQTCSVLRDASIDHSMWKNILRRICVENSMFLPSTILDHYLTLRRLEHLASAPSRFISHLRNPSPEGTIEAFSVCPVSTILRVVDNPVTSLEGGPEEILHLYLVPGGQFLISHHTRQLHIWDIGIAGTIWNSWPSIPPLATLNRHCKNVYAAHTTRDGEGLIVLAATSDPWNIMDTGRVLSVFEIYPAVLFPPFREIASLVTRIDLPHKQEHYCLTFDRLVFLFNAEISVWDFVANAKATWAVTVVGEFIRISTVDDYVILCDSTGISLWAIPPLYPCSSPLSSKVQNIEPIYRCGTSKTPGPDQIHGFSLLGDWYHGMNQPFIVDLNIYENASIELNRHFLEFPILSKDHPPTEPPIKVHKHLEVLLRQQCGFQEDCRVSDGHVVLYWTIGSGMKIQSVPLGAGASHEDSNTHSVSVSYKMPDADVGGGQSTLCSASGRMCRLMGPDMIEIVDFLKPPWYDTYPTRNTSILSNDSMW